MTQSLQRLMTAEEVAEYLHCSRRHLWNLVAKGEIPTYKLGGITRLRFADVLQYVESCRRGRP